MQSSIDNWKDLAAAIITEAVRTYYHERRKTEEARRYLNKAHIRIEDRLIYNRAAWKWQKSSHPEAEANYLFFRQCYLSIIEYENHRWELADVRRFFYSGYFELLSDNADGPKVYRQIVSNYNARIKPKLKRD